MSSKAHDSSDVALLIAIPATFDEYALRFPESDWQAKYRDPDRTDREAEMREWWERAYLPLVATPIRNLIADTEAAGVEVHTAATLRTLAEATASRRVVILFAHWKGATVVVDDLVPTVDAAAFTERVHGRTDDLARWLAPRLDAPLEPGSLARVLAGALELGAGAGVLEHAETRAAARRAELDALFAGLLRPGLRLELFDGLHPWQAVDRALASGFTGVLDLTVCTSSILADRLSAARHHAFRTVHYPAPVTIEWAAPCIQGALRLLRSGGFHYLEARDAAGRMLDAAILEAAREASCAV